MKAIRLIGLLGLALVASISYTTHAHADSENTITINPGSLLLGRLRLEIEHAVDTRASVFGGVHLLVNEPFIETGPGGRVTGSGVEFGGRFFWRDGAPAGWWIGPSASVSFLETRDASGAGYAVSMMGGYTAIIDDFVVLSFGVGLGYFDMVLERSNGSEVGVYGIAPRVRIAAGFAF